MFGVVRRQAILLSVGDCLMNFGSEKATAATRATIEARWPCEVSGPKAALRIALIDHGKAIMQVLAPFAIPASPSFYVRLTNRFPLRFIH